MNSKFEELIKQMPILMKRLMDSPLRKWSDLGQLPQKGIYVFFEQGSPIYVGRTNRMRKRIKEHGQGSSGHNKAPFAFNIAKKLALRAGMDITILRTELENDPDFKRLFKETKERVSKMSIRAVEITDPLQQTIFEVYASMELQTTEYNSFDNH